MTKTEVIKKIAEKTGLSRKDVKAVIEALFRPGKGLISVTLKNEGKVTLAGFGTFFLRERSARNARNPKNGKQVTVPKRVYPAFKGAKTLKDSFRKG